MRIKDIQRCSQQEEHCGGLTTERTWESALQIKELMETQNIVIIRSGIFELTCDYYHYNPTTFTPFSIYPGAQSDPVFKKSLHVWERMTYRDSINRMNPSDRLYYDQRLGCWLSSTEQSFDIYDGVTPVQICNNRIIISLMMGFPENLRKNRLHEEMLSAHAYLPFKTIKYDYQQIKLTNKCIHFLKRFKKIL